MFPVTAIQTRETFFIGGMQNPNFGPTVTGGQRSDLKNFRMFYLDSGGVMVNWDEGSFVKGFIVPAGNLKSVTLAPVPSANSGKVEQLKAVAAPQKLTSAVAS